MSTAPSSSPPLTEEYLNADKGSQVLAIIITFPAIALIIVGLRLYTKFKIVKHSSNEDFAILLAMLFSVATSICQGFQVYNGMGKHLEAVPLGHLVGSLKALFASIFMYNFGLTFTKISILLQYLRITIDKGVQTSCSVLLYITLFNWFQTFFTNIFSCYPIAKFWDDQIPGGCVNKPALWYTNAAINISQDIALIILPFFILRKLTLPRHEKTGLMLILGLGGFATIASICRLHALYILTVATDITWDTPGAATWSSMELNIGIICASLPTLRAFCSKFFPRLFTNSFISRQGYDNSDRTAQGQYIEMDRSILVRKTIAIYQDSRKSENGTMGKPASFHNHSEGVQVERATPETPMTVQEHIRGRMRLG